MASVIPGSGFVPSSLPEGRVPVLFSADWCGYCRRFRQLFDDVPGGIVVDISDEDDPLWDIYKIRLVPTVVLFDEGEPTKRWVGVLGQKHATEIVAALGA
jgi:thioredoxin-like negative regulator of GroEL